MSDSILLLGAGGHATACIDVIEQTGRFEISGLLGCAGEPGRRICGYPVLGTDEDLPAMLGQHARALVAVGHIKSPDLRIRLYERLRQLGFEMPVVMSPRAYVSRHASVGEGTIVMHGAIVNAGARVGRNCIINTQALVEHDVEIADHCHVATAAVINGGVRIGTGTFVGSNATVRQSLRIGERSVIGMGLALVADCGSNTVALAPKVFP